MLNIKYDNLTICDPALSNSFCKSYVFSAPKQKNNSLGNLMLTVDINIASDFASKISEIISDVIKQEYFRIRTSETQTEILTHFEHALNKVNQALSTLASEGYVEWIDKLNVGIAAININKVHMAFSGNVKILLARNNEIIDISKGTESNSLNPMKVFVNVVSGDLQLNDKLIMATPGFAKYFSIEKIKRTLQQNSSKEAIANFKNLISGNESTAVSAIVLEIKDEKEEYKENFDFLKTPRKQTISDLIKKHDEGEAGHTKLIEKNKTQKPSIENYKSRFDNFKKTASFDIDKKDYPPKTQNNFSSIINIIKDNTLNAKNKLSLYYSSLRNNFSKEKKSNLTTRPETRKSISSKSYLAPRIRRNTMSLNKTKNIWLKKILDLPLKSKIILGVASAAVLIFAFSLFGHKDKKIEIKPEKETKSQAELILQVNELEKKASDAMIYNDEEKARTYLADAGKLLDELSANDKEKKETKELVNKIKSEQDKINNITRLDDNVAMVDIPSEINAKGILYIKNELFVYDENKGDVFNLDEKTKQVAKNSKESGGKGNLKYATVNLFKDYIEFLTDNNTISEFVLDDRNIYNINFSLTAGEKITDFENYFDALYVLDAQSDQVWKHQRTIDGYSDGAKWLKADKNDLADASSFAIDGSVYVLKNNGAILSFLQGEKQEFSVKGLDKNIGANGKIFTLLDYKNLYIIDSSNERLVVLDKNGNFINQYAHNEFKNAKDLTVNEENNKAYVLCGNKIIVSELKSL